MIRVVPTLSGDGVISHEFSVVFEIDGVQYSFRFVYSKRMRRWIMSITHPNGTPVVVGAPVLSLVDLFSYSRPGMRPRGFLRCVWRAPTLGEPEPEEIDLGRTHSIVYFERVEDLDPDVPVVPPFA